MRYAALLRGIMPTNPAMANANLRRVCSELGFTNVETVISSGNLVFDASSRSTKSVEARLEAAWPDHLGFTSTTIVRTKAEVQQMVDSEPFGDRPDTKDSRLQVTFLKDRKLASTTEPPTGPGYQVISTSDGALFSVIDLSETGTPDMMRALERAYSTEISTRTWKTVNRILAKL